MAELTNQQEEYFRILQSLDSGVKMSRVIEEAKRDLRHSDDRVVRGLTRVKGFTANKDDADGK